VKNYGFCIKPGAAVKLNQHKREGYTDFIGLDPNNGAWNVIREEFDELLLKHAAKNGATVVEETRVTEICFDGERPISASWVSRSGVEGQISFEYLVDASGRNGMMSTKYLKNRRYNKSLNNVACWGYWENTGCYMPGTNRDNAVWIESLTDESGWSWFIPLHDGTTSVGIVMDQDISNRKKKELQNPTGMPSLQAHYLQEIQKSPGLVKLMANGTLRNAGKPGSVKSASDYSYSATSYAGDHYRIAGDAGAFIDPFFSSGVHLAFTGGLSAAVSISASIRGLSTEQEAQNWHSSKVGTSYTRFLLVVLGTYKQIRNQSIDVMSDVDEDNFDRAFDLIRPVIQGTADVGKTLTDDELDKTMDFCRNVFAPTNPEMYERVLARVPQELTDPNGPILLDADLDKILDPNDDEARHVIGEINARKQIHTMYSPLENFGSENHFGFKAILQLGKLGLTAA